MKLRILRGAKDDLRRGFKFYEKQTPSLGAYFLEQLEAEIRALLPFAGTHSRLHGAYRAHSQKFPYSIIYELAAGEMKVFAVVDARRRPAWIKRHIQRRQGP